MTDDAVLAVKGRDYTLAELRDLGDELDRLDRENTDPIRQWGGHSTRGQVEVLWGDGTWAEFPGVLVA